RSAATSGTRRAKGRRSRSACRSTNQRSESERGAVHPRRSELNEREEMSTILVVDDEPAMVGMVGALLGEEGHQIVTAYDGEVAPTEFRLLAALASRPGEVIDRKALLRAGWPDERDPDPEWLKAHLARLRTKLIEKGAPELVNVRGVGYRLG